LKFVPIMAQLELLNNVMYIKKLGDIKYLRSEIGGKGYYLCGLIKAGFTVPPGFIILSNAFSNREILVNAIAEIEMAFAELDSELVAVRSSASAEDSMSASWAGQLDTYLNIPREELINSIKKCHNSLSSPHAVAYRSVQGYKNISMAVIVQKMVESDISGVVFTVDPVSKDKELMVLEAGLGLGENIVSGKITPDHYLLNKNTGGFINKKTQDRDILSDEQIREIINVASKIETYFGFPCDIEWAYEKGKLYILQSRPITTL
jgi:rifampicin phosphotransferase